MAASLLAQKLKDFRGHVGLGELKIKDKSGRLVTFRLNPVQDKLLKALEAQARTGRPVRIVGLKARKQGFSTFVQALFYDLTRTTPHWFAETVAHTVTSTREIFSITKRLWRYDPDRPKREKAPSRTEIEFKDLDSRFATETCGGQYVGSGGTINALHISELPKVVGTKDFVQDQWASLRNAVPDDPNTIVIVEATANRSDVSGVFEDLWRRALAGVDPQFVAVFCAWFEDDSYRIRGAKVEALSAYETDLRERFGVDDEQVAWLRAKTAELGELLRKQEFPSTPEEAFQVATGRVFPMLTRERHDRQVYDLAGFELYRAVDWGGAHPFVALWIAHKPGKPGFSIDALRCPNAWMQFTTWKRERSGRPSMHGDDCPDAARYCLMEYMLTGWMHIYRELFIADSALKNLSVLTLGEQVKSLSAGEDYIGTVADRNRPNDILLFNQIGIPCIGARRIVATVRQSELEDGISYLHALMVADVPFLEEREPESIAESVLSDYRAWGRQYAVNLETMVAMAHLKRKQCRPVDAHPELGALY